MGGVLKGFKREGMDPPILADDLAWICGQYHEAGLISLSRAPVQIEEVPGPLEGGGEEGEHPQAMPRPA